MSQCECRSERTDSGTSSQEFVIEIEDFGSESEPEFLSQEEKLRRLLGWFRLNNVESGDPLEIQEDYLREKKAKLAELFREKSKASSDEALQSKRLLRRPKPLGISL